MDKQCPRIWELHQLQHLDMSWWRNNYWRRPKLHTLEVLQTPSVGEVCEYPEVSSFLHSYLVLNWCISSHLAQKIKIKMKKNERSCHGDNIISINKNAVASALNVLLLTLNKALLGGRPRITRFILMHISLWIMLDHASMLPVSILVCSSLDVCSRTRS